ncbi:MAG: hypothetical protein EBZ76_04715 [Synechococcaceae bacterium WB9_2_170]|nr:hypothetical protein [Synechococcaceae bacterium WB9_2_170]
MAFPPSQHRFQQAVGSGGQGAGTGSAASHRPGSFPASSDSAPSGPRHAGQEGEHKLEKLEFALAVALTRGDLQRSQSLREQIAALGGNQEEPGT